MIGLGIALAALGCRSEGDGSEPPDIDAASPPDAPQNACDPLVPRALEPELLVGPTGLESRLLERLNAAQATLDVSMYQFTRDSLIEALIAAQARGLRVRVMLDAEQGVNDDALTRLGAAGIEVKTSPATFTHFHAKVAVIDAGLERREAIVLSGNFNDFTMQSERNYGVIDRDAEDVSDLAGLFEADWTGGYPDLLCSRLVVSPVNARQRLLQLLDGATQSLDLAVMYLSDGDAVAAVKRRGDAGVPVRVLLADPAWIDGNVDTAAELAAAGIEARYERDYQLHAKLVIADGVAFIGSENFSYTSLNRNREVGLFVGEPSAAAAAQSTFDSDWAGADLP